MDPELSTASCKEGQAMATDGQKKNDVEILAERLGGGSESSTSSITYLTPDETSWIIHVRRWMPTTSADDFEEQWNLHPEERHLLKLFGKTFEENRWSQSWGFSYSYSGSTNTARPVQESAMVQQLIDRANEATRGLFESSSGETASHENRKHPYNGCLQNWYLPEDTIGLHADDERDLQAQYPIVSLTWGGTRRFVLKPRDKERHKRVELYLQDGDLLIMGGDCQKTHRHEVPKPRVTKDPPTSDRINWTIRAFRDDSGNKVGGA